MAKYHDTTLADRERIKEVRELLVSLGCKRCRIYCDKRKTHYRIKGLLLKKKRKPKVECDYGIEILRGGSMSGSFRFSFIPMPHWVLIIRVPYVA